MSATQEQFNTNRSNVAKLADGLRIAVVATTINPNGGVFDSATAGENLGAVLAGGNHIFSGMDDDHAKEVAAIFATAVHNHVLDNGCEPSEEILASAAQSIANILGADENIFDSSLSTTAGIPYRNHMIALTLPVMLNMVTADDVMMIPAGFDKSEIFRVRRIAGSTFGDLTKGEEIDEFFNGQYTSMDQFKIAGVADGTETVFTVDYKNPLVKGRTMAYIDGEMVVSTVETASDREIKSFGSGNVTLDVDHNTGIISLTLSAADLVANGLEIEFKSDIKIEGNEGVIPLIEHDIISNIVRPHESAIASSTSIISRLSMQREFGLNQNNMNIAAAANILAADKDRRNLFLMYKAARRKFVWGTKAPASGSDSTQEHTHTLAAMLQKINTAMIKANKKSGIKSIYVGPDGLSLLGYLPKGDMAYVAGYHEIPQPHVVGILFGRYKVKYSPTIENSEMLLVAKGNDYGDAGIVNGDAIPAISMKHAIGFGKLSDQNTMYEMSIRDIHPHNGNAFFALLKLDPNTSGEQAA